MPEVEHSVKTLDEQEPNRAVPLPILALVALLAAMTLELVRSTGPVLELAFAASYNVGAGTAIATYLAPGLLGVVLVRVMRGSEAPTVLMASVLVLATVRLCVQGLTAEARFVGGLTAIALSITVLTFAVSIAAGRHRGGVATAGALALGAAFGAGLQLALGTWDAYWRHNALGWGVTIALTLGVVVAAVLARADQATAPTLRVRRLWVLGPVLCLLVMVLANTAFAASQSGVRLVFAGPLAAVGLLLVGSVVLVLPPRSTTLIMAAAPAIAVAGLFWASGPVVLILLVAAQLSVVAVLAEALEPRGTMQPEAPTSLAPAARWASLVGLGTIMPLLVFLFDYDIPLGFPNELLIVSAALLMGAAVMGRGDTEPLNERTWSRRPALKPLLEPVLPMVLGAGIMVLLGTGIAVGRSVLSAPDTGETTTTGPITLVSWNVHYGVDPYGDLNLEQIARSIEEQNPSVVTLQEVSRGWVLGAGSDMATWLAERLQMKFVYSPAADRQMGNVILTNLPSGNVTVLELPYGEGPQNRSAVSMDLFVDDGPLRVTSLHLQSQESETTRLTQIDTLLNSEGTAPIMIVAGDFNSEPRWPEIVRMTDAGLISAQDVAGDPLALTDPSINPVKRIDWIFGRGVTFAEAVVLSDALSSDHLPLRATFAVAGQ